MKLTRRKLIVAGVAALGGGAAYEAQRRLTGNTQQLRTLQPVPRIPEAGEGGSVDYLVVGDSGATTEGRAKLVEAMAAAVDRTKASFLVLTGDNIYPHGVESVTDPQWKEHIEDAFAPLIERMPLYPCLGNHDHEGNPDAQVEYGRKNEWWKLPAPYHSFVIPMNGSSNETVEFFVIDTMPLRNRPMIALTPSEQLRWLDEAMSRSTATYKVAVGHHPCYSGGPKGGSSKVRWHASRIFTEHGLDLYLSGHNHDLELIESDRGWIQVVSGAGAVPQVVTDIEGGRFAFGEHVGFTWISMRPDAVYLQFESDERPLAAFRMTRSPRSS